MDAPFITVSKPEVAERQIVQACLLFFERRDPVSIHTLTAAAHTVLRDVGKEDGVKSILKDLMPIRAEMQSEWTRLINEAQNFFKHADRDPDATFDFYFEGTQFLLLDAIEMLFLVQRSLPREAFMFRLWVYMRYPDFFQDAYLRELHEGFARMVGPSIDDFGSILEALRSPMTPPRFPVQATRS